MDRSNVFTAVVCIPVAFFIGAISSRILPDGDPKLLIDLGVAVGTIGVVLVALSQRNQIRRETTSRSYREAAIEHLRTATDSFLNTKDGMGRPQNTRRHWLNFARAIQVSRKLASRIELQEQRDIWAEQEDVLRERVYDVLHSKGLTYDKNYYWPVKHPMHDRVLPIAEQALVIVFEWKTWPSDRPDPIDRHLKFTDDQRESIRLFDAPGLAEHLDELRPVGK